MSARSVGKKNTMKSWRNRFSCCRAAQGSKESKPNLQWSLGGFSFCFFNTNANNPDRRGRQHFSHTFPRNKIIELISATAAMPQKLGTTKSGHFEAVPGSGVGSPWTFSQILQFIQAFFECLDKFNVSLSMDIDLRT